MLAFVLRERWALDATSGLLRFVTFACSSLFQNLQGNYQQVGNSLCCPLDSPACQVQIQTQVPATTSILRAVSVMASQTLTVFRALLP